MTTRPAATFEDFDEKGLSLRDLRNELEVIDRAIGLLRDTKNVSSLLGVGGGGGGSTSTTVNQPMGRSRMGASGMVASMARARGTGTLQSLSASGTGRQERGTEAAPKRGQAGGAPQQHTGRDESYIIDTSSVQMGTCPHCFEEMPLTKLRKHLYSGPSGSSASSCPNQDMTCPEEGCSAVFPARSLRRHLNRECLIAKRRCDGILWC